MLSRENFKVSFGKLGILWYTDRMTRELQALTEELRIAAVLEKLLTGEATTIVEACGLAGVPRSTFYALVGRGHADPQITEIRQNVALALWAQLGAEWPELVRDAISDVKTAETVRDRNDTRRTIGTWLKYLGGEAAAPQPGEDAAKWLEKHGKSFSPVQINIHVGKEESPPIIEVEGSPVDDLEDG